MENIEKFIERECEYILEYISNSGSISHVKENISEAIKKYSLLVLSEIFENGCGMIDEYASKDDLIENYEKVVKILNQ